MALASAMRKSVAPLLSVALLCINGNDDATVRCSRGLLPLESLLLLPPLLELSPDRS